MADEEVATAVPRGLTVEERNKPILDIVGSQAVGGTKPSDIGGGAFEATPQQVQSEEFLDVTSKTLTPSLGKTAQTVEALEIDPETGKEKRITPQMAIPSSEDKANLINIDQLPNTQAKIPAAVSVQGQVSSQAQVNDLSVQDSRTKEQLIAAGSLAEAQTAELSEKATVQYQLEQLYESLEEGKPLPGWASANVRKVQEIMNARGLGDSSIAAAAMVQAISESALPIAVQDANKFATIQIQNLTHEQQTALSNAASLAAMDARNLDNKMKAAQQNAQSFLTMDMANTTNEQASNVLKYQSEVQSLFTDTAAENARLQFNAKSQTQVDQFYDQLGATLEKSNVDREVATRQFNVDQGNSMAKYISKIEDSREKFNSEMQLQIDQSNALWRRTINTENTASQNEQNKINAASLLGMTTTAQNNLWQKYRDEASFVFNSTQNELQRTHQLAQMVVANQFARDMFNARVDAETSASIGGFLGETIKNVFSNAAASLAKPTLPLPE